MNKAPDKHPDGCNGEGYLKTAPQRFALCGAVALVPSYGISLGEGMGRCHGCRYIGFARWFHG